MNQQQEQPLQQSKRHDNRKRSHSSCSSSSSSELPLFLTTKSNNKKRLNGNGTDSSADSSNTSSSSLLLPSFTPRLTAQRSVPAFLNKLYNMVEDLSTNDLIRWSKDGISFIVEKHQEFAKTVLPRFYKHNTFASFVRQLNMYDFHKVPHLQQGVLIAESEHEIWEFSNPHFQKGRSDLLVLVTRKRNKDNRDTIDAENITFSNILQDLLEIKNHQSTIITDLKHLHSDNRILWQETLNSREKYQKHQQAIEKILQFLTTIFQNHNNTDLISIRLLEQAISLTGFNQHRLPCLSEQQQQPSLRTSVQYSSEQQQSHEQHSSEQCTSEQCTSGQQRLREQNHTSEQCSSHKHEQQVQAQQGTSEQPLHLPSIIDFSKTLNTATRSAQTITQDIDLLQVNIESLANNLGIDPGQFDDDLDDYNTRADQQQFNFNLQTDGTFRQLLSSMNYSDYPSSNDSNTTTTTTTTCNGNINNYYNNNTSNNISEYNAMVNGYADMMRPPYFNNTASSTNGRDNP